MQVNADMLFYMAGSGDKKAYEMLYQEFSKMARATVNKLLPECNIPFLTNEDIEEFIEISFLDVLRTFIPGVSRFRTYSKMILNHRFYRFINNLINNACFNSISIDTVLDEDKMLIEVIEDKKIQTMQSQIACNDFIYHMSSPKSRTQKTDKFRSKVNILLYAGYSQEEIAKILKSPIGKVRYALKQNKEDQELQNSKFELK